ncbi:MAG: EAL domain-containing protein, partial [Cyanobacteria bacterium J06641_5]
QVHEPRAIGVDLYRDLPIGSGGDALDRFLRENDNVFGVEKILGQRVQPSPALEIMARVGFAEVVIDRDRTMRRALLTLRDPDSNSIESSLAVRLALHYLAGEDVALEPSDPQTQRYRLGQVEVAPLTGREYLYGGEDVGGYQLLVNWRGGADAFTVVSFQDVLNGRLDPDLLRDRVAILGTVAESTKDLFATPHVPSQSLAGAFIHAEVVSQLLTGALEGRPAMLQVLGQRAEWGWLSFWALATAVLTWKLEKTRQRRWLLHVPIGILGVSFLLALGNYCIFRYAFFVLPTISPLVTVTLAAIITANTSRQSRLTAINRQLELTNNELETANTYLQNSFEQLASLNSALSTSEDRLTQFLEALPVGVAVHAPDGKITYMNQAGRDLLHADETADTSWEHMVEAYGIHRAGTGALFPAADLPAVRALTGETVQAEDLEIHQADRSISLDMRATPIYQENGEIAHAIVAFQDITARRRAEERLRYDALHDVMTGLPNRTQLFNRIELARHRASRSPAWGFGVLFVDIDRFKTINDSLGHSAGDRLLVAVANKLQWVLRGTDIVARLGGDEYVVLAEDIEGLDDLMRLTERILAELQIPIAIDDRDVVVSASIGVVLGHPGYTHAEDLLRDADIAMYRAKTSPRSHHAVFDTDMHAQVLQRLNLEEELRRAQAREEWVAHYQPIVELATGQIVGFETLLRWQHPERGLLGPGEFISVAEDMGEIVTLDRWILGAACRQLAAWRSELGRKDLKVAVNLSVRDLQDDELLAAVDRVLAETGLPGSCLTLEITESMLVDNIRATASLLVQLRERDVRISIDDFGTGYSSLSYLHELPVDTLKIDRSFVTHAREGNNGAGGIAETIVALGHRLGLAVVAEGIEQPAHVAWLRQMGCDYGQGYWYSRPVSSQEIPTLLQNTY